MTYHQLCPHTAGLHQLVVNGEYKTVFFNGYIIIQSLQSFLVRTRNNTSRAWYRTCTNSDAKESLFHFQGVTVVTNQPVFILYVSTMNLCNPSINRGFLGRTRNNTIRPGRGTELVHILVRRSLFFPFPGRHSRNKPASLHPLRINNEPVQPIDQ